MSEPINNIKSLLIEGKDHKALKALVSLLKSVPDGKPLLNNAFLLQSRLEGIETKFNQGFTSYEKWEISRNKIIKSTLELADKVEDSLTIKDIPATVTKQETKEFLNYSSSFIHRLADPVLLRTMTFYYVVLWVVLGALDTLFFQTNDPQNAYHIGLGFNKYLVTVNTITWINDFIGHLFAFGTALLALILDVVKTNLSRTSTLVLNKVYDGYKKYFIPYLLAVFFFLSLTIYFNAHSDSSLVLWSFKIAPGFLPLFIAINYFALVMGPLILCVFHFFFLLNIGIKEFKNYNNYSPFHGDNNFGLLTVGRSIFWGGVCFVSIMLLVLILQLNLKNGELTPGLFLGTIAFFIFVWFGFIKPLKTLSKSLFLEKERLYESVKEEVRTNNRMLGNQTNTEDLNTIKLLLDASRENESQLVGLSIIPVTRNELLIGAGIISALVITIIYYIS